LALKPRFISAKVDVQVDQVNNLLVANKVASGAQNASGA
jgi:hypothetical protein